MKKGSFANGSAASSLSLSYPAGNLADRAVFVDAFGASFGDRLCNLGDEFVSPEQYIANHRPCARHSASASVSFAGEIVNFGDSRRALGAAFHHASVLRTVTARARYLSPAVTALIGMTHQMRPDESRSAEDEQAELRAGTRRHLVAIRRLRLRPVARSNQRSGGNSRLFQELTAGGR